MPAFFCRWVMIYLYSGTPGSGKSLHAAKVIYNGLKKQDGFYLANFPINRSLFRASELENFGYIPNEKLNPRTLIRFSELYWEMMYKRYRYISVRNFERGIRLFIDEAQMLFNARDWQRNSKEGWPSFFSVHRHYGFEIVLITQMDSSLDKQVRGILEYNCIHRKIGNIGIAGAIFDFLLGGGIFYYALIWYPQSERLGGQWFKFNKKLDTLYDTHAMFNGVADPSESWGSSAVLQLPQLSEGSAK